MYREFCCMTLKTPNRVLEYCELDLRVKEEKGLFGRCIEAVENVARVFLEMSLRSMTEASTCEASNTTAERRFPHKQINYRPSYMTGPLAAEVFDGISSYESCITDVLSESFRGDGVRAPHFCP